MMFGKPTVTNHVNKSYAKGGLVGWTDDRTPQTNWAPPSKPAAPKKSKSLRKPGGARKKKAPFTGQMNTYADTTVLDRLEEE